MLYREGYYISSGIGGGIYQNKDIIGVFKKNKNYIEKYWCCYCSCIFEISSIHFYRDARNNERACCASCFTPQNSQFCFWEPVYIPKDIDVSTTYTDFYSFINNLQEIPNETKI